MPSIPTVHYNGAAIRAFRQIRGLSVAELARRAKVHSAALSNIEGGRKGLSVPLANRIAQELSIEVGAIASAPVTTRPCPCHRERPPSSPKAVTQHGAAIRTIRLIRGHTVAELARRLQITTSHLSNVEHQNKNASPTLIDRIAEVLLIDPAAIICHHDHD